MPDPYTVAFNALKKREEQGRPFQVLVRSEVKIQVTTIDYWEDLLTGEEKIDKTVSHVHQFNRVPMSPFSRKGPFFTNPIESAVKQFRKEKNNDKD